MLRMLNSIIEDIRKDDEMRTIMPTGNGRTFSAGTDISGEVPQTAR
jgi:enoyl-CoA hydratase/carnithine racemase